MHRAALIAVLVALAAAGCGAGEEARGPTALEVTVWPDGEGRGAAVTATLACDPPAGDVADAAAACALLAAEGAAALAPVPDDAICTELYGGPAEARIAGTVGGAVVTARVARTNGCEIARWERLAPLLPPVAAAPA